MRVLSVGKLGGVNMVLDFLKSHLAYPIHCSVGGRVVGLATKGDSRRCFNSSGVYLNAMVIDKAYKL